MDIVFFALAQIFSIIILIHANLLGGMGFSYCNLAKWKHNFHTHDPSFAKWPNKMFTLRSVRCKVTNDVKAFGENFENVYINISSKTLSENFFFSTELLKTMIYDNVNSWKTFKYKNHMLGH